VKFIERWNVVKKEKPILFNTGMVRAILDGRKTQTRRIVKNPVLDLLGTYPSKDVSDKAKILCPYFSEKLWVRETWCDPTGEGYPIVYKADMPQHWDANETSHGEDVDLTEKDFKWKPSIHMPRDLCRINLSVESVEIERLQGISENDAKAEGIASITKDGATYKYGMVDSDGYPGNDNYGWSWEDFMSTATEAFSKLWNSIYKEQGLGWNNNPWVWVIKFKLIN